MRETRKGNKLERVFSCRLTEKDWQTIEDYRANEDITRGEVLSRLAAKIRRITNNSDTSVPAEKSPVRQPENRQQDQPAEKDFNWGA